MDEKTNVEITEERSTAVIAFKGSSISNVEAIAAASEQISGYVEANSPQRAVFDFGGVKFFSSQVLGLLLDIRSKVEAYGGKVAISGIDPQLHRVFKITNLDQVFEFFKDRQSALNAMGGS